MQFNTQQYWPVQAPVFSSFLLFASCSCVFACLRYLAAKLLVILPVRPARILSSCLPVSCLIVHPADLSIGRWTCPAWELQQLVLCQSRADPSGRGHQTSSCQSESVTMERDVYPRAPVLLSQIEWIPRETEKAKQHLGSAPQICIHTEMEWIPPDPYYFILLSFLVICPVVVVSSA